MNLFNRRQDLEMPGCGSVYVVSEPVLKRDETGEESFAIQSGSEDYTRELFTYLSIPSGILTQEQEDEMTEDDWARHKTNRDRYDRALNSLCHILSKGFIEFCLAREERRGVSRMGKHIHASVVSPTHNLVMLRISRGGDAPTYTGKQQFRQVLNRPIKLLQATAQRGPNDPTTGKPSVVYHIKGKTDLSGKRLVVFEQANASGETVMNVIPAVISYCESTPAAIDFVFLNSCRNGIKETHKVVPNATVIVGCLHQSLTDDDKWYLDDPGCGDCGAEEALVVG